MRNQFKWDGVDAGGFVSNLFDPQRWIGADYDKDNVEGATLDLELLREKTLALLKQEQERRPDDEPAQHLRRVAESLRHQIATNEPLETGEPSNLQVATLWGAKGVTADHVYILGVCGEALPGYKRDDYPRHGRSLCGRTAEALLRLDYAFETDPRHFPSAAGWSGSREATRFDRDNNRGPVPG